MVHISRLEKGKTIDHELYINKTLKPLIKAIKSERPTLGCKYLKFHHDNAKPHVHKNVVAFLEAEEFIIMEHPPYSPDLAPCDFWFSNHETVKSLDAEITKIVSSIPKIEWEYTFNKWIERMRMCIKYKGDYFEHVLNKS